jgi:hypothetical protein
VKADPAGQGTVTVRWTSVWLADRSPARVSATLDGSADHWRSAPLAALAPAGDGDDRGEAPKVAPGGDGDEGDDRGEAPKVAICTPSER